MDSPIDPKVLKTAITHLRAVEETNLAAMHEIRLSIGHPDADAIRASAKRNIQDARDGVDQAISLLHLAVRR